MHLKGEIIISMGVIAAVSFFAGFNAGRFSPMGEQTGELVSNSEIDSAASSTAINLQREELVEQEKPDLEIIKDSVLFEPEKDTMAYIVGEVRNNSSGVKKYIYIKFTLYDESGAQVGYVNESTQDLGSGELWKFKIAIPYDGVVSYKLTKLTD